MIVASRQAPKLHETVRRRTESRRGGRPGQLVAVLAVLLSLLACKKEKPLIDKPLAQIEQEDLRGAVRGLGLSYQTCQSLKIGKSSSFSCTGEYESERGKPGSDGKKRVAVTLGVHMVPPDLYEYEQSRLRSRGAIEEAGGRILSVLVEPEGADSPKAYLKRVRGR